MNISYDRLIKNIRTKRRSLNITQQAMNKLMNEHTSYMSLIETGRLIPIGWEIDRMADVLETTRKDLLK